MKLCGNDNELYSFNYNNRVIDLSLNLCSIHVYAHLVYNTNTSWTTHPPPPSYNEPCCAHTPSLFCSSPGYKLNLYVPVGVPTFLIFNYSLVYNKQRSANSDLVASSELLLKSHHAHTQSIIEDKS